MRPEQEPILLDMIHGAAYKENTLGLPKLCPLKNINAINRDILMNYLKLYHSPDRIVIAGVGVINTCTLKEFVNFIFVYK